MRIAHLVALSVLIGPSTMAYAAGNADAGRQLVTRSCTTCHAMNAATNATDGAPPLSVLAKDNKGRPAWIRGWLMEPHPPMPTISLSRQQIDDVMAYLSTLPST